jgi:hypothetical protein
MARHFASSTYLFLPTITILILPTQHLTLLLLITQQRTQNAACRPAERVAERAGDAFFEGGADGAEGGAEDFACRRER